MNIVQFWHSSHLPDEIQQLVSTWATLNPDIIHTVYNADSAARFMRDNYSQEIYRSFRDITIPAMYCDVFRVAYILKKGGLYVDCGTKCYQPLKDWGIDGNNVTVMRKWHGGIWNGLICAPAEHPWMQEIWGNIKTVLLDRRDGDIFSLTGPHLFTTMVNKEATIDALDTRYSVPGNSPNERPVTVITQADFSDRFDLVNDLKHKSRSHWSLLQQVIPLFESREFLNKTKKTEISRIEKKFIVYLAHNQPGIGDLHQRYVNACEASNCQAIDIPLTDIDHARTLSQTSASDASILIAWIDLTSCMSAPDYKKNEVTHHLNHISSLCHQFENSEVVYSVMDQIDSIEVELTASESNHSVTVDGRIKPYIDSPALNFNIIDEALRFFFPNSTVQPVWSTADSIEASKSTLERTEIDQIKEHFSESNINLYEKYPALETQSNEPTQLYSAA